VQPQKASNRTRLVAVLGAVIVILAAVAIYYETISAPPSQSSQVSSLASEASSLSQVISSQGSQIQSLESQLSSTAAPSTTTVTSTISTIILSTTTATTTKTITSTVFSQTTVTSTVTMVSYSVLPVGEPDAASANAVLNIPGGNGSGTLQLSVTNTGNDPIVGITVVVPSGPDPTSDLCTSACTLTVLFNQNPISYSNPLPLQSNAIGSLSTTEGQTGGFYALTVNITYADGTTPPGLMFTVSPS